MASVGRRKVLPTPPRPAEAEAAGRGAATKEVLQTRLAAAKDDSQTPLAAAPGAPKASGGAAKVVRGTLKLSGCGLVKSPIPIVLGFNPGVQRSFERTLAAHVHAAGGAAGTAVVVRRVRPVNVDNGTRDPRKIDDRFRRLFVVDYEVVPPAAQDDPVACAQATKRSLGSWEATARFAAALGKELGLSVIVSAVKHAWVSSEDEFVELMSPDDDDDPPSSSGLAMTTDRSGSSANPGLELEYVHAHAVCFVTGATGFVALNLIDALLEVRADGGEGRRAKRSAALVSHLSLRFWKKRSFGFGCLSGAVVSAAASRGRRDRAQLAKMTPTAHFDG